MKSIMYHYVKPNVINVGYDAIEVLNAIKQHIANGNYKSTNLYGDGQAGQRIAEILATVPLKIEKVLTY